MRVRNRLGIALGAALALLGALVSTSELLDALGRSGIPPGDPLRQGAVLFRLGLIVLGLYIAVLGAAPLGIPPRAHRERDAIAGAPWAWAILLAILVACAILCFHRLDDGLWLDEIITYVHYARRPFGQILSIYDEENQHVLYSLLAHASFVALGESTWALRLPAVLFGIGSVWALFLVGRFVGSTREALLSSALLAFSYPLVWFSQDARGYTGLLFLTLLSSWFFLRGLREARPHLWVFYAITVSLGVYIHMTMLFVIAGHFIQYLVACFTEPRNAWPQRWIVLLYGFGLSSLLVFQLYALVIPQVLTTLTRPGLPGGDSWTQPWWAALEFARGLRLSFSGSGVAFAALVVFAAGLVSFARTDCTVPQLLVLPTLICVAVKLATKSHLWPRSLFFAAGFMALIAVRGTMVLGQALARPLGLRPRGALVLATALSMALILAAARSIPLAYGPKQDFAGALAFVNSRKEPGDPVVTVGLAAYPYQTLYRADAQEIKTVAELDSVRARAPRTWLLYTLGFQLASVEPALMRSIERNFVVERQFPGTLGGGAVFVCRSDRAAPGS